MGKCKVSIHVLHISMFLNRCYYQQISANAFSPSQVLKLFTDTKGEFSVKITTVIVEYGTVSAIPINFLLFNLF
jgi:hypothetical protein